MRLFFLTKQYILIYKDFIILVIKITHSLKRFKAHIAFIFLTVFISVKLVGLHALTHEDSTVEDCSSCEYVIVGNKTPIICLQTITINFTAVNKPIFNSVFFKITIYFKDFINYSLFSRPPPIY
ncbi:hypothetical protein KUL118_55530 [Tenacibaculum sp. KUL118]|nr:hypothetical protein KUL118_55530 [Tenacibaculum sp. KUL118]